ncbi:MAG: hypothetical protein AB7V42_06570 [Thermoleophilia bacterium]
MRRGVARRLPLAAALVAAGIAAGPAVAIPPGGAVDNPGNPPATIAITTPQVSAGGTVGFVGTGWLNSRGEGQRFYIKIDDHGSSGIGPFQANADGTVCGTLSLTPPAGATPAQRADYAPADIGDPAKPHWLRFLAGPYSGMEWNAPARSLHGDFAVVDGPGTQPPACDGVSTPPPSIAPPPPSSDPAPPAAGATRPALTVARRLRPARNRLAVTAKGGSEATVVTVTVRSAARVRLRAGARARLVQVTRPVRTLLRASSARRLSLPLSAAGRALLRHRASVTVIVRLAPAGGAAVTRRATLRRGLTP